MRNLRHHFEKKKKIAEAHIDPKLLRRLIIFSVIIAIIAATGGYRYYRGDITLFHLMVGLIIGTSIGYIAGRMFRIFWHEELERVMSELDKMGVIFLVVYIGVEVGRNWLFGHWLSGVELSAFGIVFLGGLLFGRFLSMIYAIQRILVEKEKI
ncbi:hypothetical protein KBC86_00585 [Candidatus Gracilibacteria bacterium]|nr:hypothetical protein [Candidatus Gracilibacteria bacterium]